MRLGNHCCFHHSRVRVEGLFNLDSRDVLTTTDDHILGTVFDLNVPATTSNYSDENHQLFR